MTFVMVERSDNMKKFVLLALVLLSVLLLAGCSISRTVRDSSVRAFNQSLKEHYPEIRRTRTSIMRPTINWKFTVDDGTDTEAIFKDVVTYFKTDNVYDRLKKSFNSMIWAESVTITFYDRSGNRLRDYTSSLFAIGTTIYQGGTDNEHNVIDDFNTWRITSDWATTKNHYYLWDAVTGTIMDAQPSLE